MAPLMCTDRYPPGVRGVGRPSSSAPRRKVHPPYRSRGPWLGVSGGPGFSRSRPSGCPAPNPKSEGEMTMRFMLLVKADKNTEAGVLPSKELVAAMGQFNEEMVTAG